MDRMRRERGAYAVLYAVITVVMVGMAAIMLDLGALRYDVRSNQTVADFASTSAALDLNPVFGGTPHKACLSAWGYFLANTTDAPNDTSDPCAPFIGLPSCDPRAAVGDPINPWEEIVATGSAGPYQVTIAHPVPDDSPYMEGRLDTGIDAGPCDRIAVQIVRTRGFVFGPVLGSASGDAPAQAVARSATNTGEGEGVALVLLDPTGCDALRNSGKGKVNVFGKDGAPGIITVDSAGTEKESFLARRCKTDGNGNPTSFTMDAFGQQNPEIHARDSDDGLVNGVIFSYALKPGQGNAAAYEEGDVTNGRLSPRPVPGERVTRRPIDWRYNCRSDNFCPWTDSSDPYIDELRAFVGTTGAPPGFQTYPADVPGASCGIPSSGSPLTLVGDWFIDCDGPQGFKFAVPVTITGGNVVFAGDVRVGGTTGELRINEGSSTDRWIYFRSGGEFIKDAQSTVVLDRVLAYIDDGRINLGAGDGPLTWISPEGGNFEDLALWSESPKLHVLGGQANVNVVGTFFIPLAGSTSDPDAGPFTYNGQGDQVMDQAQFVVYRMEVKGQGTLNMTVDPERSTLIPLLGVRLIR